jgi:hypothetical protein
MSHEIQLWQVPEVSDQRSARYIRPDSEDSPQELMELSHVA